MFLVVFIGLIGSSLTVGGHAVGNDLSVLELSKYYVLHTYDLYTKTICLSFLKLIVLTRYIIVV